MNLIRSAYMVFRKEGIRAVFSKTKNKILRKITKNTRVIPIIASDEKYANVYFSYLQTSQQNTSDQFVACSDIDLSSRKMPVDLIAFYLPQFHPIPENDQWWGKGFTEWVNVPKGVPNYVGHNQPRLPGELGFYDLRVPEIQHQQVRLAKKFGIGGFCFYYYWFDGKKLLETPIDAFANDATIDFPFCLCWANENWTRRWDGLEKDILIAQNHSPESDIHFISDLFPYISNKNYLRWEGKPVILVYRPLQLPDPLATTRRWRAYCQENGMDDIYLVAVQTPGVENPYLIGFDAVVEFPPHGIPPIPSVNNQLQIINPQFDGSVFRYSDVAAAMLEKEIPFYPYIRGLFLAWDNTARMQNKSLIFHDSNPSDYGKWLASICSQTLMRPEHSPKMVFINAWNEWAEGTYLEPDRKYGYAYLQTTAETMLNIGSDIKTHSNLDEPILPAGFTRKNDIAVVLHLYYTDFWPEIKNCLQNLDGKFDLFVSIPNTIEAIPADLLESYPDAVLYRCPNRGRDIAPFLAFLNEIRGKDYLYLCKIHTKKSSHRTDGENWRSELYAELLGSTDQIMKIIAELKKPETGMVCPKGSLLSTGQYIGGNLDALLTLAHLAKIEYSGEPFTFSGGSMFWCKPDSISKISNLHLTTNDFPEEKGQIDGTVAHAIERFFGLLVRNEGYKLVESRMFSEFPEEQFPYAEPIRN